MDQDYLDSGPGLCLDGPGLCLDSVTADINACGMSAESLSGPRILFCSFLRRIKMILEGF